MLIRHKKYLSLALLLFLGPPSAWALFPTSFTYQGSLKHNGVVVNGTYPMEFRLTNSDGSQMYWTSGVQNIVVQEGLYRAELTPTNINWGNIEPYVQVSVSGIVLLPREKLNSAPYALTAKELAPDAISRGNLRLMGNLGIGELSPTNKLHIVDTQVASNQDEAVLEADSIPSGNRHQLRLGYRANRPAIQSTKAGIGPYHLLLNPDGGNVGIGLDAPPATLTLFKNNLSGQGITNTLFGAGYSSHLLDGNRQFWLQQWVSPTTARTYLVGNGYVTGTGAPEAHDGPYTKFQGIEFSDASFGFVYNSSGTVTKALTVNANNGYVGIGTHDQSAPLEVVGDVKVHGAVKNENGLPAFFVNVLIDDCGWPHPYLGCPAGYQANGRWHVNGPNACDSLNRGIGYTNGSVSGGWMTLCTAE